MNEHHDAEKAGAGTPDHAQSDLPDHLDRAAAQTRSLSTASLCTSPIDQFRDALIERDIEPPDPIEADGKLHRCYAVGKKGQRHGAYLLHLDGIPAGGFQNWRDGRGWENWRADIGRRLTPEEEAAYSAKVDLQRRHREAEEERQRAKAAVEARSLWESAEQGAGHPYLLSKRVDPHGLRVHDGKLLVPMLDANGTLHSLQRIDADGNKRFLPYGRKRGCHYFIGTIGSVICVAEGFATGASVHEATRHAVAVAFDAGNLKAVAQALRQKHPKTQLVLCADDDYRTEGNPGLTKAHEAAAGVGGVVAVPDFGENRPDGATDFNDLHQAHGPEAVRRCVEDARKVTLEAQHPDHARGKSDGAQHDGVILVRGTEIKPEPISWLWPQWLALGKVHLLAGAPGQGKTTLALAMAATVSTGGRWPCGSRCEAGNVLIWSGEDDAADTLLPRLIAMGADRKRVYFIQGARVNGEVVPFDPARDLVNLTAAAEQIGAVRLLIVDPVVSAVTGDSHKNSEVRRGMQPLVDLAPNLGAAVVGITHLSKGTAGRDPTERVTGSIAFTAVVRVVLLAAKVKGDDGDDRRILVRSKSNIGPDDGGFEYHIEQTEPLPGIPTSIVTWGAPIDGTARELLAEAEAEDKGNAGGTATDDAVQALLRFIARDTVPSQTVIERMKAEGFSVKVTRTARERIGVILQRKGFGKDMKSYWKLPEYAVVPPDPIDAHSSPHSEGAEMGANADQGREWRGAVADGMPVDDADEEVVCS